ncbi:hypothetical protein BaRGS_00038054 [Batillaria attramentaria]|uniref:Uncharacterized protein n=1 Tax=Batillaria attramentaria TaxID=370345 RepID=A0ABD0J720_9CAEN
MTEDHISEDATDILTGEETQADSRTAFNAETNIKQERSLTEFEMSNAGDSNALFPSDASSSADKNMLPKETDYAHSKIKK